MLHEMSATVTNWLQGHFYLFFLTFIATFALGSALLVSVFGEPRNFVSNRLAPWLAIIRPSVFRKLTSILHWLHQRRSFLIFILGIIFSVYAASLIAWENLISSDDFMFFPSLTNSTQWIYPPIWPASGRFFPLGHQEFYPLSLLNNSVTFYQLFAAVELAVILILVVRILNGSFVISLATCAAIMLTPGIVKVFLSRIDPERNMLVLLALLVWGALRYRETGSITAFILTSLASLTILFCKETAFILVGGWALLIFLVGTLTSTIGSTCRRRLVLLALPPLVGSCLWLLLYLVAIYPQIQDSYAAGMQRPMAEALKSLNQIWVFSLLLALVVRFYVLRSAALDALWDGWLLSIFGAVCAYILLQFSASYYTAPAAFLSWLYAGHVAQLVASHTQQLHRNAAISIASFIIFAGALLQAPASFKVFSDRKEFVASRAKAAEFVYHFVVSRNAISRVNNRLNVHFDRDPYRWAHYDAALFAGYLKASFGLSEIVVGMPTDATGVRTELCVSWMPVECHYGLEVKPGDLFITFGSKVDGKLLKEGYNLIYTSENIGFWKNNFKAHILIKE